MRKTIAKRIASLIALVAFAAVTITGGVARMDVRTVLTRAFIAMIVFYVLGYVAACVAYEVLIERLKKIDEERQEKLAEKEPETGKREGADAEGQPGR